MKKLLATLSLTLPSLSQAAIIYTDEALFLADYENPIGHIDFSVTPARNPAWSANTQDFYQGESWVNGIVFETRSAVNQSLGQQVAVHDRNGADIYAADLYADSTLTIQLYRPQSVIAIFTNLGFFGWAPELNTDKQEDALFALPQGARISSVDYGFTARPVEAPEPAPLALLLAGLVLITLKRKRSSI